MPASSKKRRKIVEDNNLENGSSSSTLRSAKTNPRTVDRLLDASYFQLPSGFSSSPDKYEIWSMFVPIDHSIDDLDKATAAITLPPVSSRTKKSSSKSAAILSAPPYPLTLTSQNDEKASSSLLISDPSEVENCRLLIANKKVDNGNDSESENSNDDDEDDNDDDGSDDDLDERKKKRKMNVLPQDIDRNFKLLLSSSTSIVHVATKKIKTEDRISVPHAEGTKEKVKEGVLQNLPKDVRMAVAYAPVPQKKGLMKRWQPYGTNQKKYTENSSTASLKKAGNYNSPVLKNSPIPSTKNSTKTSASKEVDVDDKDDESEQADPFMNKISYDGNNGVHVPSSPRRVSFGEKSKDDKLDTPSKSVVSDSDQEMKSPSSTTDEKKSSKKVKVKKEKKEKKQKKVKKEKKEKKEKSKK